MSKLRNLYARLLVWLLRPAIGFIANEASKARCISVSVSHLNIQKNPYVADQQGLSRPSLCHRLPH